MSLDPTGTTRVSTIMTRRIGTVLLCLAVAACHGDDKKGGTTPKSGSGSGSADQSMHDSNDPGGPVGGGGGNTGTGNGNGSNTTAGNGGNGGGSGSAVGNDPNAPVAPPEGPPIVAPNLDPDPTQAKSAVDQHLAVARAALSAPTPDADAALKEAKAALAIDATNLDAAAMIAFAYYHKKLYDTGELILDDVFKRPVAKQNANIFYVYGLIYDKTSRPAQAEVAFNTAVQLNPNFPSALVNVGVHQLQNQQYAAAQATFEKLTGQFNRNDAITLTSLGSAYRGRAAEYPASAGEHDQFVRQADSAYKRATQANAGYGPAYYNLGLLYLDNDPFPGITDALVRLQSAKDFFDKYKTSPGFDLKLVADRQKDVDKAIKKAQKKANKKPAAASAPAPANP
jgi:tetratricopeptide (TPR) repeat protein